MGSFSFNRRERSDKRYSNDADRQRAFRERMKGKSELFERRAAAMAALTLTIRQLAEVRPRRWGWAAGLSDDEIAARLTSELLEELTGARKPLPKKKTACEG
jgi:hypothetical protein